jgi:uncharacterized Zn-binding protein involved in type VI secretion
MQAAARLDDPIAHTSAAEGLVTGMLAGALAGAALVLGAALIVGTGGLSAPLVIGIMLTGIGMGGWIGEFFGSLSFFNKIAGKIATGSHNVFINFRRAARAEADTGQCSKHGPAPPQIATGSHNVFINFRRAARVNDKLVCGGFISEGSPDVFIGGGTYECKRVEDEVPWQAHWLVMGAGIGGALLLGGAAAIPAIVGAFAVGYVGGEVMGWVGRQYGDWLSENIGGTPSDWGKAGTFVGQALGGWLGAKVGPKAWGLARRGEVEPNALGTREGNIPMTPKARGGPLVELLNDKWGEAKVNDAIAAKRANTKLDSLLTDQEYLAIRAYTSPLYKEINPALRSGKPGEWQILAEEASSGMDKMANNGYGYNGIVTRDVKFSDSEIANLFPDNGVFTDKGFMSTTTEVNGVFPGNTRIIVDQRAGVNIKEISEFPNESEILFKPGSSFDVVSKTIDPHTGKTIIHLKE